MKRHQLLQSLPILSECYFASRSSVLVTAIPHRLHKFILGRCWPLPKYFYSSVQKMKSILRLFVGTRLFVSGKYLCMLCSYDEKSIMFVVSTDNVMTRVFLLDLCEMLTYVDTYILHLLRHRRH
jgi:hypothetical protein